MKDEDRIAVIVEAKDFIDRWFKRMFGLAWMFGVIFAATFLGALGLFAYALYLVVTGQLPL